MQNKNPKTKEIINVIKYELISKLKLKYKEYKIFKNERIDIKSVYTPDKI